jgi:hypothetical protein
MMTEERATKALKTLKHVYGLGTEDAYKSLLEALEAEETSLKQYGRTELYGLHFAINLVKKRMTK